MTMTMATIIQSFCKEIDSRYRNDAFYAFYFQVILLFESSGLRNHINIIELKMQLSGIKNVRSSKPIRSNLNLTTR